MNSWLDIRGKGGASKSLDEGAVTLSDMGSLICLDAEALTTALLVRLQHLRWLREGDELLRKKRKSRWRGLRGSRLLQQPLGTSLFLQAPGLPERLVTSTLSLVVELGSSLQLELGLASLVSLVSPRERAVGLAAVLEAGIVASCRPVKWMPDDGVDGVFDEAEMRTR